MSRAWKVKVSCDKGAVLRAGFPTEFSKTENFVFGSFSDSLKASTEASLKRDLLRE